ncbi:piggyBac transposable element-derived protein 3-like [Ixodes scapularis]|uniref:piggyBac transposable element-derived protein 3-like n=1 Tax=Ixodes scapularis TaxID=6945 RepID=UPI001A9ED815|nr:piggyBac transposable element-derived protein 3-like [Ixodes scapularis]
MPRDIWLNIKNNLHLNDNDLLPQNNGKDKPFKIRPFIDILLPKFQGLPKTQKLVIDEQMFPFKGRSSLKQYLSSKPHKYGYKIFVLCDIHGMTYLLFFDNWFTSVKLLVELHHRGISAMGTIRANRTLGCRLPSNSEMKKNGTGSHEERQATFQDVDVRVVKWYDSRGVTIVSMFGSAEPLGYCKRYDRKRKETCDVPQPAAVKTYNSFMGGVDLLDGLMAYYSIFLKLKKFYLQFFFHFVDMALVSSWPMYRRVGDALAVPKKEQLDLLMFKVCQLRKTSEDVFAVLKSVMSMRNPLIDASQSWDDVTWLKSITHLPVVAKENTTGAHLSVAFT